MALLDIRNLTVTISTPQGEFKAVERFSLTIAEGEIRALAGESGSGKSLVAKAIVGLTKDGVEFTADRLRLGDVDLKTLSSRERRRLIGRDIAMIFQEPSAHLDPSLKIGAQLMEAIPEDDYKGSFWMKRRWLKKQAISHLHKVGVKEHRKVMQSYPHSLSEVMCQKVMIAMALANQPRLLIADEPTTEMEPETQQQILRLLDKVNKVNNTAILLISHDMETIGSFADNVTVMYCGQVVESGSRRQVLRSPRHPYTHALLKAMPDFENDEHKGKVFTLRGSIPALSHLPIGCRLGPRCPHAQRQCVNKPQLRKEKGHAYACHFPLEIRQVTRENQ